MASIHSSLASEQRDRAPIREILDRALAGARLGDADAIALIECPDADLDAMISAAAELRDRGKGRDVTYSRKVFLPVTNLCRDRCTYCTFRKDPGDPGAWTMMPDEIALWSRRGAELGCKEALMCLGDKPEVGFKEYRDVLATVYRTLGIDPHSMVQDISGRPAAILPVEAQPTVRKPSSTALERATATTRSLNESVGWLTASFLI